MADQTMTDQTATEQRADSLAELSKKASQAVKDSLPQFLDCNRLANHILNRLRFDYNIDTEGVDGEDGDDIEDLADTIARDIASIIETDELADVIAGSLKKTGLFVGSRRRGDRRVGGRYCQGCYGGFVTSATTTEHSQTNHGRPEHGRPACELPR